MSADTVERRPSMAPQVVVFKHPGFVDRFKATLIPGLHKISSAPDVDPVSVVSTEAGEVLAVQSRHVFTPEGLQYAEEWATKTHSTVFDVKIPEALSIPPSIGV
jgi:hypothetical protein